MFIITPSHMWGRLYLPPFLFRVGLLILMQMNSLMVLVETCPSMPIMLKFSFHDGKVASGSLVALYWQRYS